MTASSEEIERERQALENCENEPIALIGSVQPFGWLLATDLALETVTHVSENVSDFTGSDHTEVLGSDIREVLDRETLHRVRNIVGHSTIRAQREFVGQASVSNHIFDLAVHVVDHSVVYEFLPAVPEAVDAMHAFGAAQMLLSRASTMSDLQDVLDHAVRELRHFTDYDRVMAYRFLPDGAGEVVAESVGPAIDSFLGLRFPAFDIPQSARRLYATTPIRVISSVVKPQPPLHAMDSDGAPLDLSLALLRGSVAVHSQYLTNMNVGATMSLPIVVDGDMWGLFALHHSEERAPSTAIAMSCELVGRSISLMIQHEQELGRRSRLERCNTVAGSLFGAGENPLGFGSYWRSASQQLATLVDCDGVALVGQERVNRYGSCPADHVIQTIVASSLDQNGSGYPGGMGANVTVTNSFLADVAHVDAAPSAGAITLLDPLPAFDALVFFRDETSETVRWAGTTEKKLVDAADGLRLNPRASFDEYLDSTAGRCRSWEQTDIDMVDALGQALQRYYASQELREQHQGELGLVVRELNHRVRNILAVVKSLIGQTSGQAADLPGYVQSLEERIAALAGAHDLLTENDWKTIGFDELCRRSLRPYLGEDQNRVAISGEPVRVIARVASAMSLVLHELASNAAKYGALSVPSGRVVVRWTLTNDSLSLQWTEQGGPAVREPSSVGFGTSIIRDSLSFEFDASSTLFFAPSGVEARFVLPASLVEGCAEPGIPEISVESEDSAAPEVRRVLLLEDDYIVSCETKAMIERCTESAVSVTPSIEAAFTAIKHQRFDAAVLDVNIRGEFSGPVAERLAADGVPFVFATGYGSRDQQLQDFGAREILTKPILEPRLATVLADLLADQPGGEEI